jgi:hypothetical protein
MSNELAIAAVTATLRNLLVQGVPDLPNQRVTTMPPDRARPPAATDDQLNLFLYQTTPSAAWRNTGLPGQSSSSTLPLALNLHYLITAFGQGDDETRSHRWLGSAMRVLHDHPLLGAREIRDALAENDLHAQIERVRIVPQPLSLEEMSKLWTTFQTQYRISSAYEVDVVLIESRRPARPVLPVLRRGDRDQGVDAVAGASLPSIDGVRIANAQSSAFLGDQIVITGQNLGSVTGVRFTAVRSRVVAQPAGGGEPGPITNTVLPPAVESSETEVRVTLPNDAAAHAAWPAGFYSVAAVITRGGRAWTSNELGMSLAPRIETIAPGNVVARDASGNVTLTLTCTPLLRLTEGDAQHMRFAQTVELSLGTARQVGPELPPAPPPSPAALPAAIGTVTFTFHVDDAEVGQYLLRLRVDGVDLPRVNRTVTPPEFDAAHMVKIT